MAENTSGNLSILQHQIDRFGAVTVMDAMLYDYSTQKPVLKLDTLKVSSINFDGNSKVVLKDDFIGIKNIYSLE